MSGILVAIIVILVLTVVFLAARAKELLSVLRGEEETTDQSNLINSSLLLGFLVFGFIGIVWSYLAYSDHFLKEPASQHGHLIDQMFVWTTIITLIVFVITHIALFWFTYKYRSRAGRKAQFFSHDNKLEIIWTVIPAIVLTILVAYGIDSWYKITGPAPKQAVVVEVTGQQFNWLVRYPGKDAKLGEREFRKISGENALGMVWEDTATHDDFMPEEIHLEVGKPVLFVLGSKDVLHAFYLPHFRVKMDCVPGIPTQFWFVPTITTDSMRIRLDNPKFDYELACAELCGPSHWNMRKVVVVENTADYNKWVSEQVALYKPDGTPTQTGEGGTPTAPVDSAAAGNGTQNKVTSEVKH